MGWDDDMIKTHEFLKTITDPEKTSQQQNDKDAYIDGIIDASKPFDSKPEFPPKKKLKHMGAHLIKVKKSAPETGSVEALPIRTTRSNWIDIMNCMTDENRQRFEDYMELLAAQNDQRLGDYAELLLAKQSQDDPKG